MSTDPLLEVILPSPDALPQTLRAARRRRTVRHALTVSPIVLAGFAAAFITLKQPATTTVVDSPIAPDPFLITTSSTHAIPVAHHTPATTITTRPRAFTVVSTTAKAVPTITDEHLLALASTPGHPAAIVHHQGHPKLLTTRPQ